jgi:glyoxylase-like metal-dependent hydrolase (beta-lactamase superfamily II)
VGDILGQLNESRRRKFPMSSKFASLEEIPVEYFYQIISQKNDILLLDIRSDPDFEGWKIEARHTPETIHVPYTVFAEDGPYALESLPNLMAVPEDRDIAVICGQGDASDLVADILRDEGKTAVNVIDGMIDWGNHYVWRPVVVKETIEIYQMDRVARGCLSYLIISDGRAAIIDPLRHTDRYQSFLSKRDVDLKLLLDTHAHADHISGGPDLAEGSGAKYWLHPYDAIHPFDMLPARIDFQMLADGQEMQLGQVTIWVLHTPGHTLGQVNFIVSEPEGEIFAFTGDNIFIQSFGRPDLGGQGEAWVPIVYDTIFRKFKDSVPEDAWILPGHYANFKEANEDGVYVKRLSKLWRENFGLHLENESEFADYVLNHLPGMPVQYIEIKRVNIGLSQPNDEEASELELGKNVCALSDVYG